MRERFQPRFRVRNVDLHEQVQRPRPARRAAAALVDRERLHQLEEARAGDVQRDDGPGRPDGSAVDADGCLWNAEYAGGRLVRYTPAGRIDRVIAVPVSNPTCCAFGGSRFDTLFVTSAAQRLSPEQLAREPLAGGLFAVQPGVSGLPESRFRGGLP